MVAELASFVASTTQDLPVIVGEEYTTTTPLSVTTTIAYYDNDVLAINSTVFLSIVNPDVLLTTEISFLSTSSNLSYTSTSAANTDGLSTLSAVVYFQTTTGSLMASVAGSNTSIATVAAATVASTSVVIGESLPDVTFLVPDKLGKGYPFSYLFSNFFF